MSETLFPQELATVDPSRIVGNNLTMPELPVWLDTFEGAQAVEKQLSDKFVKGALEGKLQVGGETVGIKGYLDKVEATRSDDEVIANPDAIAALYQKTTDMLARNLTIMVVRNTDPVKDAIRKSDITSAKEAFLAKLQNEAGATADGIVDWSTGKTRFFPTEAMGYDGLEIDGRDPLDADGKQANDFRPNFKIQRQIGGVFIMAYSNNRVREKLQDQDQELTKRIYLNPEVFATPDIFEQVLDAANQAGLSVQLKMYQRAPELAQAHFKRENGSVKDGLRGDGIVIYANEAQANDTLAIVLAIAKDKPEAFIGRKTSRIPQRVAEGIAVGDEPTHTRGDSLTSHRTKVFEYAVSYVRESGKTGKEAEDLFRRCVAATAEVNKVNPRNIAFNTGV